MAHLERDGDVIEESVGGQVVRRFTRRDGVTVEIDWGGAHSVLHDTGEAAAAGSGVDFSRD